MSKILVLEGKECRTMREACNWLREAYMYEPYNIWCEDLCGNDIIFMEANRGNPGGDSYEFYGFEEILSFVGHYGGSYIKEIEDGEDFNSKEVLETLKEAYKNNLDIEFSLTAGNSILVNYKTVANGVKTHKTIIRNKEDLNNFLELF